MVRERIRLRFSKTGNLCFIGHRDLLTTLERLFRRIRLPLAMSEGFHPKIRMSSPSALPLGVAGEDEVLELELSERISPGDLLRSLNENAVEGLRFEKATVLRPEEKKAILHCSVYEMEIPPEFHRDTEEKIARFLAADFFPIEKHNGKSVDLRSCVSEVRFDPGNGLLEAKLLARKGPEAGIREFLFALDLHEEMFKSIFPVRKKCLLETRGS